MPSPFISSKFLMGGGEGGGGVWGNGGGGGGGTLDATATLVDGSMLEAGEGTGVKLTAAAEVLVPTTNRRAYNRGE